MIDRRSRPAAVWMSATNCPSRMRRRAIVLMAAIAVVILTLFAVSPVRAEIATGPEVGTKIPDISAYDQYGKMRSFEDLSGPEGLLILFYRTADW